MGRLPCELSPIVGERARLRAVSELVLTGVVQRLREVAGDWQRNEQNDVVEAKKATSAQREFDQLLRWKRGPADRAGNIVVR